MEASIRELLEDFKGRCAESAGIVEDEQRNGREGWEQSWELRRYGVGSLADAVFVC